ncbi:MAG: hypothetical protein OHK0015_49050 [Chloroflexi bacterium OHK40]
MATFEQHISIDAPMDTVWAALTNPGTWGLWFPGVKGAVNLAAVRPGESFTWQDGNESGSATITHVDEAKGVIRVVTQDDGRPTTHTFDIDRTGGFFGLGGNDTKLIYRREYDAPGGFVGEFVAGGNPLDSIAVKDTLQRVKNLIEKGRR